MSGERPTLADVARRAGVSPSTASLALNDSGPVSAATRVRVEAAAQELGYAGPDPRARSLRRGRSGIVGVVLEDSLRDAFRDPMNVLMLDGIADVTGPAGNSLLLITERAGGPSSLVDAPIDAVVLFGCSPRVDDKVAVVRRRGLPIVSIEGEPADGVVDVGLDNREATRALAQHLRDLGHRDVALVTLELDRERRHRLLTPDLIGRATTYTAVERMKGAFEVFPEARGFATLGSTIDEGLVAGRELLADTAHRPTAIIGQSDLLATGVIRAAAELGLRVPDDLSVVGFDGVRVDDPAADGLTTMVQPAIAKGQAAGRAVLGLLAGEEVPSVSFTSEFRRGRTTASPAASASAGSAARA
ncbi:substrate-binding domain-containing protein [Frondihabitans australicus]|uniref:LacI family transcriptional regulator n=1 Tax=Frondihabitans australicus TaxID=386892 RepID=A0A495IK04_9MICO|nr:substrate-binding domain-containing protein [Frondihabitans australicus]RKR75748.1 LacI family transcriptional regulator [Frondihabitans australicus]